MAALLLFFRLMRTCLLLLLCVVAGCGRDQPFDLAAPKQDKQPQAAPPQPLKGDAIIENGEPYDGCSWVVQVGLDEYAPDLASEALVRAFTKESIGKTSAKIEYSLSGNKASVICGWSGAMQLPEISISAISTP